MLTKQQVVVIGSSEGFGPTVAKAARTFGARVLAVLRMRPKLEAERDAVGGSEVRVADINNTATIQVLFSELLTVDHVFIAAAGTKSGGQLNDPLSDFRHKFNSVFGVQSTWFAPRIVSCVHVDPLPSLSGLASDRPVCGACVSGIATMATEQLAPHAE